MISDFVCDLCQSPDTVTSVLAKSAECTPGDVAKKLFAKRQLPRTSNEERRGYDLERAYECGRWGATRPSDLFLKVSVLDSEGYFGTGLNCCRFIAMYWQLSTKTIL